METPSFTFRLERVRTLRERAEERAREALSAELRNPRGGRGAAARRHGRRRRRARRTAVRVPGGRVSVDRLHDRPELPRDAPSAAAPRPRIELARRDAEVAVKRQHLAVAARDRQAIDKLKERRKAEHDAEWARRSQNTLDELALAVHRRGGAVAA